MLRCLALLFFFAWVVAAQGKKLGAVDFFAYDGVDIAALRTALPVHAGEPFSVERVEEAKKGIRAAVEHRLGRPPSDIAVVCCDDHGDWILFIGLRAQAAVYREAPRGRARLPKELVQLDKDLMQAWMKAVEQGASSEEHSEGYALSSDPELRSYQMKLHGMALRMEGKLFDVLASSSDDEHRAIAANALGYARQSPRQLRALVEAAGDASSGVRNNAVRALGVLLESNPRLGDNVPARLFTDMVQSGTWTDRNKGAYVLLTLTASNRRAGLPEIAAAAGALREMSQWQSSGHASAARTLLERIAAAKP
ncbi:MAG: HEAT repeat domain-containing protein [Bryobacteraceae bacterium]